MRTFNPGIIAYKNLKTVKVKEKSKSMGMGLLAPKSSDMAKKTLEPVERIANYVSAIREQRDAYKNGDD